MCHLGDGYLGNAHGGNTAGNPLIQEYHPV